VANVIRRRCARAMTKGPAVVKKKYLASTGAMVAAAAVMTLGCGMASAESSVLGQTYQDAKATLRQQGFTPIVESTVGDRRDRDLCLVTRATPESEINGFGNEVMERMDVDLNCYADYSTESRPGFSIQSPEGRAFHEADVAVAKLSPATGALKAQQDGQ
jgi:hypothetical protein